MDASWVLDSLKWLGSTVTGAGFASYYIKKSFDHKFNKELAEYNLELNKELAQHNTKLNEEVESLKAELQRENTKEQIKYNMLHERRESIIEELNSKLLNLDSSVSDLMGLRNEIIETLSIEEAELKYFEVMQNMTELFLYQKSKKIYLSNNTNRIIYDLIGTVQVIGTQFYSYYIIGDKDVRENLEQNIKKQFKDDKSILEDELSRLLGVTGQL
ncbi:hypothetical protein P4K49_08335 [Bacillus cereus]|uniref:hypothetical protein n=1 Tax=Bacillus thuringiensis TaxID=1428 RepID=UPI000680E049|nr:hypothetical protein [Bacillus thuringiensis]MEB8877629.1 hypothetical protein [Bacillus cereus]MBG9646193.1 hypothetical protein [Bacillus thuringiensis]MBG9652882.1 hypothetical protein [Bacillus thuringiensis]MEB9615521.1 hypothetical protein [Bacillus cereus]MEB9642419.1 hypothetical protein [Bacillus cereus]